MNATIIWWAPSNWMRLKRSDNTQQGIYWQSQATRNNKRRIVGWQTNNSRRGQQQISKLCPWHWLCCCPQTTIITANLAWNLFLVLCCWCCHTNSVAVVGDISWHESIYFEISVQSMNYQHYQRTQIAKPLIDSLRRAVSLSFLAQWT